MAFLTVRQKVSAVVAWSKENEWFASEFIDSLKYHLEEHGALNNQQLMSLDVIISQWSIDVEAYDNG